MALDLFCLLDRVRSLTLRDVPGDSVQTELTLATDRGSVTIRCIGKVPLRVLDLRRRDRAKRRAQGTDVPLAVAYGRKP